jgi:hypothetical protein
MLYVHTEGADMPKTINAALYARVSTTGQTVENQLRDLCPARGKEGSRVQGLAVGEWSKSPSAGWIIGTLLSKISYALRAIGN